MGGDLIFWKFGGTVDSLNNRIDDLKIFLDRRKAERDDFDNILAYPSRYLSAIYKAKNGLVTATDKYCYTYKDLLLLATLLYLRLTKLYCMLDATC